MLFVAPRARPILKWAGGKTQLLDELFSHVPKSFDRYVEPFFGGGALFFALQPKRALIADSNPELINLYRRVAADPDGVAEAAERWRNTERDFYAVRRLSWQSLSPNEAAARMLFLNKTCFNGLYRVNRKGEFNVPFGRYKNPRIVDRESLRAVSLALINAEIVCADFKTTLKQVSAGDFVFLDPPYVPVSAFSDFKRYTKEQFREEQHRELASEIVRLSELGCEVLATNSDTELVHQLYSGFQRRVVQTKRHISRNGAGRVGKDVLIYGKRQISRPPKVSVARTKLGSQVDSFPPTRFMGSKSKLLEDIWSATSSLRFDSVVDLFAGTGIVGYMFKCQGKRVLSNDHMAMSHVATTAMIENSHTTLSPDMARGLLRSQGSDDDFVRRTFNGLYFSHQDEETIDIIRTNVLRVENVYERAIAKAALVRACLKKRPRGIFTYTGVRYDDGRKDLKLSIAEHFFDAVDAINRAVFSNGTDCSSLACDALSVDFPEGALIYVDPPYWSPLSDNDYVRRYHFVEGLARDWRGVEIQAHTATKKFKAYETPFRTRNGASDALLALLEKARANPIVISYSSNGEPKLKEMIGMMRSAKRNVKIVPVDYKYSFGTHGHKKGSLKNDVSEYLFVGY